MGLSKLFARAQEIYYEEGLLSLLASVKRFAYGRVNKTQRRLFARFGMLTPYHERKRTDSEERWKWISNQLESDDGSAMDIGCASGFFPANCQTADSSQLGLKESAND